LLLPIDSIAMTYVVRGQRAESHLDRSVNSV